MNVKIYFFVSLLMIAFLGCHEVAPIELIDNEDDSELIELKAINNGEDSLDLYQSVDSSALVGAEGSKYFARMIYAGIYFETPNRKDSILQTDAIFFDKTNPIRNNGQIVAYPSLDVGSIAIDSDTLNRYQKRVRIGIKDSMVGYFYQLRKAYNFESNNSHSWYCSGKDTIKPFSIRFMNPSELRIEKMIPHGLQIGTPLYIKWRCNDPVIDLIISKESGQLKRAWTPILYLRIKNEKGEVKIPAKILEILPTKRYQHFLFTFSSSKQSKIKVEGYPDEVLVQAASIHNVWLNVLQ